MVEPWLRGTLVELAPVQRAVVHALELAGEDVRRWCFVLGPSEMETEPFGLPSVAFQVRHMARSLDRLLTYAEGLRLSDVQLDELASERVASADTAREFETALSSAMQRVRGFSPAQLERARGVGREKLPTTVAGLLIHAAEHTQRHVGQAITTAKVVAGLRRT